MEEVRSSILLSSTPGDPVATLAATVRRVGFVLGGLVAGEGSFLVTRQSRPYADGSERPRFVFAFGMAERDVALVHALQSFLGVGSTRVDPPPRPGWQPMARLTVSSVNAHLAATIPFADAFLLPSAKRDQFERWRARLAAHLAERPLRWGQGRSTCRVAGCPDPVRGRGLCRRHYYRETGL